MPGTPQVNAITQETSYETMSSCTIKNLRPRQAHPLSMFQAEWFRIGIRTIEEGEIVIPRLLSQLSIAAEDLSMGNPVPIQKEQSD